MAPDGVGNKPKPTKPKPIDLNQEGMEAWKSRVVGRWNEKTKTKMDEIERKVEEKINSIFAEKQVEFNEKLEERDEKIRKLEAEISEYQEHIFTSLIGGEMGKGELATAASRPVPKCSINDLHTKVKTIFDYVVSMQKLTCQSGAIPNGIRFCLDILNSIVLTHPDLVLDTPGQHLRLLSTGEKNRLTAKIIEYRKNLIKEAAVPTPAVTLADEVEEEIIIRSFIYNDNS